MEISNNLSSKLQWESIDLNSLLSKRTRNIGKGNDTDAGRMWRLPTDHPDPIVLAGGIPDDTVLPIADLIQGIVNAVENHADDALNYGGWFGYEGCRNAIAPRQNNIEGTTLTANNIIMHNGSSGCLENILKAFIEPGDVAIVESPSYSGTVRAILGYQAEVIEIPMQKTGVDPEAFKTIVNDLHAEGKRVKLFYTIPDFHNPMGNVTSLEIREKILQICSENQIIIAEDAAYTELHFENPPPSSYYALSDGHGVIKMCSFSKILATGLRAGWIQARPEFAEPLTRVRFDMGTSPLVHYAIEYLINSGNLDKHVKNMRSLYQEKCSIMIDSLRKYCSPYIKVETPEGGYFLWIECLEGKAIYLVTAAAKEGVIFPLGSVFFVDKTTNDNHFRLAYTRESKEHLKDAGKRIRSAFEKILD